MKKILLSILLLVGFFVVGNNVGAQAGEESSLMISYINDNLVTSDEEEFIKIYWETNVVADECSVNYSKNLDLSGGKTAKGSFLFNNAVSSYNVELRNLTARKYYYKVKCTNSNNGNIVESEIQTFVSDYDLIDAEIEVIKYDNKEDIREINIKFLGPAITNLKLVLYELPNTEEVYLNLYDGSSLDRNSYISSIHGKWDKKLKPNKTYKYVIDAINDKGNTYHYEDTFKTGDFEDPGDPAHYTKLAKLVSDISIENIYFTPRNPVVGELFNGKLHIKLKNVSDDIDNEYLKLKDIGSDLKKELCGFIYFKSSGLIIDGYFERDRRIDGRNACNKMSEKEIIYDLYKFKFFASDFKIEAGINLPHLLSRSFLTSKKMSNRKSDRFFKKFTFKTELDTNEAEVKDAGSNLIIEDVYFTPHNPVKDTLFSGQVHVVVKNIGSVSSNTGIKNRTMLYRSRSSDHILLDTTSTEPIAAGKTKDFTYTLNQAKLSSYFLVYSKMYSSVDNYPDNFEDLMSNLPIKKFYPENQNSHIAPDLIIEDIYFKPQNPIVDEPFISGELRAKVKNIGSDSSYIHGYKFKYKSSGYITRYWSNFEGTIDAGPRDVDIRTSQHADYADTPVDAGETKDITLFRFFRHGHKFSASDLEIVLTIDHKNEIKESNENNNTFSKKFTLQKNGAQQQTDSPTVVKKPTQPPTQTNTQFTQKASSLLTSNKLESMLREINQFRNTVKEQETQIKHLTRLVKDVGQVSTQAKTAISNFITYGVDENTKKLGEGERAAVMFSYKSAFNKLPETETELADAIKIANGRWPSITNKQAEDRAKKQFEKIYQKIADMNNPNDNAAVTVMAYGLRQKAQNRNLDSERQGIKTFKYVYGHHPNTTDDWNIMQAITYSGATRGTDTDKDLLTDEREAQLGTDPNNPDTDGDGFKDGVEVANGHDPLNK